MQQKQVGMAEGSLSYSAAYRTHAVEGVFVITQCEQVSRNNHAKGWTGFKGIHMPGAIRLAADNTEKQHVSLQKKEP